jgi:hypothetical protein
MRGRLAYYGKIQHGGNVFASMGLDWCPRCRSEQDCDTDAEYGDGVYVYRRRCCRCGVTVKFGAYQVPVLSDRPMPEAALVWCHDPGKDRR